MTIAIRLGALAVVALVGPVLARPSSGRSVDAVMLQGRIAAGAEPVPSCVSPPAIELTASGALQFRP